MAIYSYTGRDPAGKIVQGTVEARGEREAVTLVKQQGFFVTRIVEKVKKQGFAPPSLSRVGLDEIVNFTRQLSTMVTAGLQLPEAITILRTQATNEAFRRILSTILHDIEGGGSFGASLAKYPKLFSNTYISLVKAGESSGNFDKVLTRLAENLEKDREFRSKVKGALIYPVIIVIAMIVVVGVMMIFVIPQLSQLYKDFGLALPFTTKLLITVSDFTVRFWWLMLVATIVAFQGIARFRLTPVGKKLIDSLVLRLPIFGPLTKEILLVEFTRTLGMLIGAGIHILDGLAILSAAMPNVLYKEALLEISRKVEKGFPLGAAFAQYEIFPPILSQMIKVGEETGKLDETLLKLSSYFESESEHTVKGLTLAIEPIIMVVLGIGVGFIVISIITPIYNLTSQIK